MYTFGRKYKRTEFCGGLWQKRSSSSGTDRGSSFLRRHLLRLESFPSRRHAPFSPSPTSDSTWHGCRVYEAASTRHHLLLIIPTPCCTKEHPCKPSPMRQLDLCYFLRRLCCRRRIKKRRRIKSSTEFSRSTSLCISDSKRKIVVNDLYTRTSFMRERGGELGRDTYGKIELK